MANYKKSKKRSYSITEKVEYHSRRVQNENVSSEKRMYSRHWLDGFKDSHAKSNLNSVEFDINRRKKNRIKDGLDAMYYGYRNGLKANIKRWG